ncbi:MAG TPA: GDSL-type esterase/lipase family protein, partial [Vicinamibacteria bacterium]|nr:GDSL-type esterase/lipase family protein [Vicinamibacteria bacterium]
MRSRRRAVLLALCLLLAAELGAKLLLLTPWIRARLPADVELGWRVRWAYRRLSSARDAVYTFDVYDPATGWALRPGLRGHRQFVQGRVSSNSRGLRGTAEYAPGRVPGRRRVVVLGDSFTFGEHVDDHEAFPARLQQRLGPAVDVLNLGVHGYGHDQMLIRLREEGLRYAPDLVVLGFFADDAARNLLAFRDYAKPRFVLREGRLLLLGSPVPPPSRILWREARRSHLLEVLTLPGQRRAARRAREEEQGPLMAALLDEMRRVAAGAGARFAIVDLPPPDEIARGEDAAPAERLLLDYAR